MGEAINITKYAVNSTIGVSDFTPLNKMIRNGKISYITDTKQSNVYSEAVSTIANRTSAVAGSYTALYNGVVRFEVNCYKTVSSSNRIGGIGVFTTNSILNATEFEKQALTYVKDITTNSSSKYYLDVNVIAGQTYYIQICDLGTTYHDTITTSVGDIYFSVEDNVVIGIKSVQRGTASASATVAISPVNTNKSFIIGGATFVSSTEISVDGSGAWQVIEFY